MRWLACLPGWLGLAALLAVIAGSPTTCAGEHRANVPPGDEIVILDPNADARGRPAIELRRDGKGELEVDIPPVVLVHRYYYTGDRSFQAQILPGGPTIIVANHPHTGERCYVETSMMPGAPVVTYTHKSIEYDLGEWGMTLTFPWIGQPKVTYRSGLTVGDRIGNLVHADLWKQRFGQLKQHSELAADSTRASVAELTIDTGNMVKEAFLPVQQVIRVLPMGSSWFDPDRDRIRAEKIAEHRRQKEAERAQKQAALDQLTVPTNR